MPLTKPISSFLSSLEHAQSQTILGLDGHCCSPCSSGQFTVNQQQTQHIILRHVGENDIDCVRVSTHYYNNESDLEALLECLVAYAG